MDGGVPEVWEEGGGSRLDGFRLTYGRKYTLKLRVFTFFTGSGPTSAAECCSHLGKVSRSEEEPMVRD